MLCFHATELLSGLVSFRVRRLRSVSSGTWNKELWNLRRGPLAALIYLHKVWYAPHSAQSSSKPMINIRRLAFGGHPHGRDSGVRGMEFVSYSVDGADDGL